MENEAEGLHATRNELVTLLDQMQTGAWATEPWAADLSPADRKSIESAAEEIKTHVRTENEGSRQAARDRLGDDVIFSMGGAVSSMGSPEQLMHLYLVVQTVKLAAHTALQVIRERELTKREELRQSGAVALEKLRQDGKTERAVNAAHADQTREPDAGKSLKKKRDARG